MNSIDEIKKLKELLDEGAITQNEFEELKKRIFANSESTKSEYVPYVSKAKQTTLSKQAEADAESNGSQSSNKTYQEDTYKNTRKENHIPKTGDSEEIGVETTNRRIFNFGEKFRKNNKGASFYLACWIIGFILFVNLLDPATYSESIRKERAQKHHDELDYHTATDTQMMDSYNAIQNSGESPLGMYIGGIAFCFVFGYLANRGIEG